MSINIKLTFKNTRNLDAEKKIENLPCKLNIKEKSRTSYKLGCVAWRFCCAELARTIISPAPISSRFHSLPPPSACTARQTRTTQVYKQHGKERSRKKVSFGDRARDFSHSRPRNNQLYQCLPLKSKCKRKVAQ